jgi:hypothetical protein
MAEKIGFRDIRYDCCCYKVYKAIIGMILAVRLEMLAFLSAV